MKITALLILAATAACAATDPISQLNDRGLEATDRRDFAAAEQLFTEAIARWRALGPTYAPHIAITQTNLAQVYAGQGDRARAAETLTEAFATLRRTAGLRNLNTLTTLNLLAGLEMMIGNEVKAAALFEEALPIERELFPGDVQLSRTLSGLASIALRGNQPQKGLPLAEEGLALAIQTEGEESLDAALAYANVAEAHRVLGHPDRSAPLFRKSRAIYERRLGPEHPRVASVLTQEGLIALGEHKLGLAENALTRSLQIIEKSCPNCVYERVAAQNDLALLRIRQGKYDEADHLLTSVLSAQEKLGSLPGGDLAVTLRSLAFVRQKQKKYEDADRLTRRASMLTMALH